jgi:5,10-methylenetetrahydromethanopterin reductase
MTPTSPSAMRLTLQARAAGSAGNAIEDLLIAARHAHGLGLRFSTPQIFDLDVLTALAVVGREVPGLDVESAVVPIYARHPIVMAMQALTVQASTGGRLTLGIGLCHQWMVEGVFGLAFSTPVRHMREYLEVLMPLLHEREVDFAGDQVSAKTISPMAVGDAVPPPVLVAALGAQMLRVAGRLADGTTTWMVGPRTIADHIVPTITHAAEAAGRRRPQVVVGLPVCVTSDPDAARDTARVEYDFYSKQPSYRAMLDMENAAGPGDVAIVGDEEAVAAQLRRLLDVGATSFRVSVYGSAEERTRTEALLAELARR